jgi:hypothetical protein
MYKCKGCDKPVQEGIDYHKKCYETRMIDKYDDPKMDAKKYPVKHNAPIEEPNREDQYRELYKVLGAAKASNWIADNTTEDINMEEIFRQIMEGEIDYDE